MIRFVHPEAFLLLLPALVVLHRVGFGRPAVVALRLAVIALALTMLAEPYTTTATAGRDLVVVVDRSRSVGTRALDRAREALEAAADAARAGDRVGVVAFGREAALEVAPTDPAAVRLDRPAEAVGGDGTDLLQALDRALAAIPPGRRGSVLLVSDGEGTAAPPWPAARAALRRGVRIDVVPIRPAAASDVAVEELSVPGEVALGEPLRIVGWVRCEAARRVPFRLLRDGEVIAVGERELRVGSNRLTFRDLPASPGVHRYDLVLEVEDDAVPGNDRALGVLRVAAARRILLINQSGHRGRLATALAGAGLEVDVVSPGTAPLSIDGLDPYAAVVLENVPAQDLPLSAFEVLRTFVEDLGGGLMMTGGKASFGIGGYRRTSIEAVLPVTMEIRQEQRRFSLAMAIALDRSGSMAAPAGPGRTKMDLANLGTVAAIEMLGAQDEVAVIAVDSAPHVVVPLAPLAAPADVIARIATIESGGGGIFVGVAIDEMAKELAKSATTTRHMVLFADAADAEQPGDYRTFVPELRAAGITLSVIALGQPTDPDAELLLELARLGGGRCKFVADPLHLPRLFAQEAILVARASFADAPTAVRVLPDLIGAGEFGFTRFPDVGGYSIAWLEPGATAGLLTDDQNPAPLFSFWQRGLGRAAAFLGEVDGASTGALAEWEGQAGFFATIGRWLAGARSDREVWTSLRREGHEAVLTVELAAGAEARSDGLVAVALGPDGAKPLWLERTGARRLESRFPIEQEGAYRVALQVGPGEVQRTAPVALPYSPEFEPRIDRQEGERALARIAEISGGRIDPPAAELLAGPRDSAGFRPLGAWFGWLALALWIAEIAVRRLELRLGTPRFVLRLAARRAAARAAVAAKQAAIAEAAAPAAAPDPESPPLDHAPAPSPQKRDLGSVLDRARQRATRDRQQDR